MYFEVWSVFYRIRGKFLSVYLTLVRGKYDPLLEWPFALVVSITLLDQNPDPSKRCDISYRIDPRKIREKTEFLERPLLDKNGSFGAQTFCRLEIMENYIEDDVMFLQIEIGESIEEEGKNGIPAEQLELFAQKPPCTPDVHSVMSIPLVSTPREDGRLPTAMKIPEERLASPLSVKKVLPSRDSMSELPPLPVTTDGLPSVSTTSTRPPSMRLSKNAVAPMPEISPYVVSEKSEIPEIVEEKKSKSKAR
ncbi:unnamed protein product [Cylicostephanus goldi]|uniref:MATH domain-containing protein n=1 Tax=Cylicostephanus goldi TaxID=71465 RepID=A0A3P7MCT7_CYLGO|nr:unnamed protein product [Cylicostephanus goldi]